MKWKTENIDVSNKDLEKGLILPKYPSRELTELTGIIIGDGYLYNRFNKYRLGIVGNPKIDDEYFTRIRKLIKNVFGVSSNQKIGGRGLRIVINSKGMFGFFTLILALPHGEGKGATVKIPKIFVKDKILSSSVLRGIFDTDGTIFTSDKKGAIDYPCIELTTTSIKLAKQVKGILAIKGFRVANIRESKSKHSKLIVYKVSLYGKKNVSLWHDKIGFSNPNKYNKLMKINGGRGI